MKPTSRLLASFLTPLILSGCIVPDYDVPKVNGAPTIGSIERRIVCELVYLVREHRRKGDPANWAPYDHGDTFRQGDYQVVIDLSLLVTDSGELAPNLNFIKNDVFSFNAGFKISKKRAQNFSERLSFSMPLLEAKLAANPDYGSCPSADTNLAGDLGIEKMVTLALTSQYREETTDKNFGGYVSFDVYYDINATGPNWKLATFEGPGKMGKIYHQNTDQLTFSFVPAKTPQRVISQAEASQRATDFLNQLNLNRLGDALSR